MSTEEIIQGNELIAKFEGWEHIKTPKEKGKGYWNFREKAYGHWSSDSFKYHTSWDWLMPVVEKIEGLGNDVVFHNRSIKIVNSQSPSIYAGMEEVNNSKIESVWLAAVDFIKFYNQNQPPTQTPL